MGLLVLVIFVIWPAWIQRPMLVGRMDSLRSQIQTAQNQVNLEAQLMKEKKEYEDEIQKTQARLFTHGELQGILSILSEIAEKAHVVLLSSQPEEEKNNRIPALNADRYESAAFIITVEGSYHALATFVSELENYKKLLRIEELIISPQEEKPTVHLSEIKISSFSSKGHGK